MAPSIEPVPRPAHSTTPSSKGTRMPTIATNRATMGGKPSASTTGARATNARVTSAPGTRNSASSLASDSWSETAASTGEAGMPSLASWSGLRALVPGTVIFGPPERRNLEPDERRGARPAGLSRLEQWPLVLELLPVEHELGPSHEDGDRHRPTRQRQHRGGLARRGSPCPHPDRRRRRLVHDRKQSTEDRRQEDDQERDARHTGGRLDDGAEGDRQRDVEDRQGEEQARKQRDRSEVGNRAVGDRRHQDRDGQGNDDRDRANHEHRRAELGRDEARRGHGVRQAPRERPPVSLSGEQ